MKPYYETELGKLYHGDCLEIMPMLEPVDLVVTSPPYDDLRDYEGYIFDFEKTAKGLYGVMKNGGCVVWVVGDKTVNGSETGTSFKQALFFKGLGFNIHDTMIYYKRNGLNSGSLKAYIQRFEYMFVFSKGEPKYIHLIRDRKIQHSNSRETLKRQKDGKFNKQSFKCSNLSVRTNVWGYLAGLYHSTRDKIAFQHPAIFPEPLAQDHILSWSNKDGIILDPMCGAGTTCKMAEKLNRRWIGIEIEEKYCEIAAKRIRKERQQLKLFH